MIWD
jgi:nitrogen regulatory protein PII